MYRSYLRLKGCPRCRGDILVDRAIEDGEVCIQCGFRKFVGATHNKQPEDRLEKTVTVVDGQAKRKVVEKR